MSDEFSNVDSSGANNLVYESQEVNSFHSDAEGKKLSADTSSATSASESVSSAPSIAPAVTTAVVSGTGVVGVATVLIIALGPKLSNLPSIQDLSTIAGGDNISYSFSASYHADADLYVVLSGDEGTYEKDFALLTPISDSSSGGDASSSSEGAASSATYQAAISGIFSSLKAGSAYTLTILSNPTANSRLTLKSVALQTLADTTPHVSFLSTTVDYAKASLSYQLSVVDPASLLNTSSFALTLVGQNASGSSFSTTAALEGDVTAIHKADLSSFVKGNYLRLTLSGCYKADAANSSEVRPETLAEAALYY